MWNVRALMPSGEIKTVGFPTKGSAYEAVNIVADNWEKRPDLCVGCGTAIALQVEDGYGWNILFGDTC